ncbi:MAG: (2E,6E)-farnesyl diphosphate synthase [Gammaproteobacteria bacterium]|nr:(2E,6E)-farnesyl diphosphate synthase [Gammaproteobacteria bacterium]
MSGLQPPLDHYRSRVESALETLLPNSEPHTLHLAMRYATLDGGKRVRATLTYLTGSLFEQSEPSLDAAAAAIEMVHAYSLIHDDLPAMDDDDLRRGKPTTHIKFDEATAILAGDALQTLAFEILAANSEIEQRARLNQITELAQASGSVGMVGGQMIDIEATGQQQSLKQLQQMHAMKTGALIRAAVRLGYLASGNATRQQQQALDLYAESIGLAFQIRDDILDIESDTETLGKPQGSDLAANKSTYPALLGLDGAKAMAATLHQQALEALDIFDEKADPLRNLSSYIIDRIQ